MRLTSNFWLSEFRCRDGTDVPKNLKRRILDLAQNLEVLRAELGGRRITIVSGYRTPSHNRKVGGSPKSFHVLCKAADIQVRGIKPQVVYATARQLIADGRMASGGLGLYSRWVHYDTRGRNARWRGR